MGFPAQPSTDMESNGAKSSTVRFGWFGNRDLRGICWSSRFSVLLKTLYGYKFSEREATLQLKTR